VRILAAVLAAAAASTSAQAGHAACGRATARAAITSTHLRLKLLGDTAQRVDPESADEVICFDFTRDGRVDLAVSIASGGTAGDIGFVVFRRTAAAWRVVFSGAGYNRACPGRRRPRRNPARLPEERRELLPERRLRPPAPPLDRCPVRRRARLAHEELPPL